MTGPPTIAPDSQTRWRERRRFLLATLAITLLYLGIQQAWMWGAVQLARQGWTVNDPALTYTIEANEIAARSRPLEAQLPPGTARLVFQLGYDYGYLNQWLGGYGQQPEAVMQQLSQPVEIPLRRLQQTAEQLGVAPLALLPMRTAADFSGLSERLENDESGPAARIEARTSPRLRHFFLLAAHVGTQAAALESPGDVPPIPKSALIGQHATLAGVPEGLWRPLSRLPDGNRETWQRDYLAAVAALEQAWP